MEPAAGRASRNGPSEARLAIERFLSASKSPVFVEPGNDPIPITPGNYSLEWRSGYLTFEVWDDTRNLSRRVTTLIGESRGRLEIEIERFGKRTAAVALIDQSAAKDMSRRSSRLTYREVFRRGLLRHFPGWRIAELSTESALEHSLSPAYPRALIRKGASGWAAIGAGPESDVDGVLTFGLIWLDYLRARERRITVEGLAVVLPEGEEYVIRLLEASLRDPADLSQPMLQGEQDLQLLRNGLVAPQYEWVLQAYKKLILQRAKIF